jgi:hypothetical protein
MISCAAVDVVLVYQVPSMIAAGLPVGLAATIGGLRGFAQVGGRLPLSPLLHKIGTKATLVTALIVALAAVLLLTPVVLLTATGFLISALILSPRAKTQRRPRRCPSPSV